MTCFEASGGLRSANEERGETRDEDEDEGRGERWGWSEDEGKLVALSSHAAVALDARAVRARGLALWVTESDSELNARSTLTVEISHVVSPPSELWDRVKVGNCSRKTVRTACGELHA